MAGGAPEEQGRRSREQIVAEEVISTVDEEVFCGRATARTDVHREGAVATAQATARVDVLTASQPCLSS